MMGFASVARALSSAKGLAVRLKLRRKPWRTDTAYRLHGAVRSPTLYRLNIVFTVLQRYDLCVVQKEKFAARIKAEFLERCTRNPRYSLRAFALFLRTDHSTLSQLMRGKRPMLATRIRGWGKKLGLDREEILAYVAAEQVLGPREAARQDRLKHWTAEAMSILSQPIHWQMLRLCRKSDFRADSRDVARKLNVTVDEVNMALSRLLRLRLMKVSSNGAWSDATGLVLLTEARFRKLALARIREQSAHRPQKTKVK